MKLIVRCPDRMVFEVDRKTLDPKRCSVYDAYCYTDPDKDVEEYKIGEVDSADAKIDL